MPENLFGEEQQYVEPKLPNHEGWVQKLKKQMGYRKANVYKGEIWCKYCAHYVRKDYHDKVHLKCELIGDSNCEATDIRAKYTCNHWSENG